MAGGSLGLHELHARGRLHFEQLPGSHMQFSLEELYRMLDKYMAYEADGATLLGEEAAELVADGLRVAAERDVEASME